MQAFRSISPYRQVVDGQAQLDFAPPSQSGPAFQLVTEFDGGGEQKRIEYNRLPVSKEIGSERFGRKAKVLPNVAHRPVRAGSPVFADIYPQAFLLSSIS